MHFQKGFQRSTWPTKNASEPISHASANCVKLDWKVSKPIRIIYKMFSRQDIIEFMAVIASIVDWIDYAKNSFPNMVCAKQLFQKQRPSSESKFC